MQKPIFKNTKCWHVNQQIVIPSNLRYILLGYVQTKITSELLKIG